MALDIFEQLYSGNRLPRPSDSALKLARLAQQQRDQEYLAAIQDDVLFANELVRYVNSFSSLQKKISSCSAAVSILGTPTCTNLAIIFSLLDRYRHYQNILSDIPRYWQYSLARATVCKLLAEKAGENSNLRFTCSLVNNIGELAQITMHTEACDFPQNPVGNHTQVPAATVRNYGYTPEELTYRLLTKWGLEHCINGETARAQFNKYLPQGDTSEAIRLRTALADAMAEIGILGPSTPNIFIQTEQQAEALSITGDSFGTFFDEFCSEWKRICTFFDVTAPTCLPYHQMKTMDAGEIQLLDPGKHPLTILIVDDEPIMLQTLRSLIAAPQRKILVAEGGEEALALALKRKPHILITDWRMPDLNGLDLCKIIRKTNITQHTYIIMLTSCEEDDELVLALAAGADDYIVKPFTPEVLQARLNSGERMVQYQLTIQRDREVISRYASRLAAANKKLQGMAMTDFLTGLPNRRSALNRLQNLIAEVQRYGEPLSCLMIDIDHFKSINDTYGHDCGDIVLKELSQLFVNVARNSDTVSRWGGEEFIVISAHSNDQDTWHLAERIRRAVEKLIIHLPQRKQIKVTVSIGIGSWAPAFSSEDELIKMADTNLYLAKTGGRNMVVPAADKNEDGINT